MWTETVESAPGTVTQVRGSRPGPDPLRQDDRRGRDPRRPRHQGRADRRAAGRRAHGRCGALLRGRRGPPFPHPARREEPLRPDRRDRRLRDDGPRPRRRSRTPPRCSSPGATSAHPARRSSPGWKARGRCWSRSRRWSRRPRSARRAAPSSAGTPPPVDGARRARSPWRRAPRRARRLSQCRGRPAHPASRPRTSPRRRRSSRPSPARRCRPTRLFRRDIGCPGRSGRWPMRRPG